MQKSILMVATAISMQCAMAQNVSFEAYKIADMFVGSTGQSVVGTMGMLAGNIEQEFVRNGVNSDAAQRFVRELRALGKTDYAKAYAEFVGANFSHEEQRTLLVFLESDVGKKYVGLMNPESVQAKAFGGAIFREVCKRSNLTSRDIQGVC